MKSQCDRLPALEGPTVWLRRREIRIALWVFMVAGLIRSGYSIGNYMVMGRDGLMGPDSHAFLLIAQFLAAGGGVFESPGTSAIAGGFPPDLMPLAFWSMSLMVEPTGIPDPLGFVLVQGWIDATTCVAIGYTARIIRTDAFLAAGLLAAINPTQIVVAGQVYTDTIFLFFCVLGLLGSLLWFRHGDWLCTLIAGFGFGAALLTRPFALYWLPILFLLMIAGWVWLYRRDTMRAALQAFCVVGIALIMVSPMAIRNYSDYARLALNPQTGVHLLFWVVPLVQEAADGTLRTVSKARGDKLYQTWPGPVPPEDQPFLSSDRMTQIARSELARIGYYHLAAAWATGAALNLAVPAPTIAPIVRTLPHDRFFAMKSDGLIDKATGFVFQNNGMLFAAIIIISAMLMPFWLILAGIGFTVLIRSRGWHVVAALFLLLWGGYTLGIAGPVISPKYRLPLEGVWVIFASIGFLQFRDLLRRWGWTRWFADWKLN